MSKRRLQGRHQSAAAEAYATVASPQVSHDQSATETGRLSAVWPKVARALSIIIIIFGVLAAATTAIIVFRTYSPIIDSDQWIVVNELMQHGGHFSAAWLWEQFNEHRIPLGKLACYADLEFFGGRNVSLFCEIYFIQAMEALLLTWMFRRFGTARRDELLTMAGFFVFCAFYPVQIGNFIWGFEVTYVLLPFAVCLAIGLVILHADLMSSRGQGSWCSWLLLASLASAVVAEASLASGIFVWPLLLLMSIIFKMPLRTKGLIAGVGCTATAAFLWGYHSPERMANPIKSLRHPLALVNYVKAYLAWSWDSTPPTRNVGLEAANSLHAPGWLLAIFSFWPSLGQLCAMLAAIIVIAAFARLAITRAKPKRLEAFLLTNTIFFLVTSMVTALGRIHFGLEQATSSRYQTIAMAFWGCFMGLLLYWRCDRTQSVMRLIELQAALVVLLLVSIPRFAASAAFAREQQLNLAQAYAAFIENPLSPQARAAIAAQVSPYPDFPAAYMYLLAHHIGPDIENFRPLKGTITHSGVGAIELKGYRLTVNTCNGFLEEVVRVPGEQKLVTVRGWAWNLSPPKTPPQVLLALQSGTIVGSADVLLPRPDVRDHILGVNDTMTGWMAEASLPPGMTLRAFAVSADSQSVCPLNDEFTRER